jgi:DNA-binding MarR family transcriptional regulator
MSGTPPEDLEFFLTLTLAASAAWPLVQREFKGAGIEPGSWGLLFHIRARGTITPTELAEETGTTTTTIRDQVEQLARRGLVRREPNPFDARSYLIGLTAGGERELRAGLEASHRVAQRVEDRHGDLGPLRDSLLELIESLHALRAEGEQTDRAERVRARRRTS